MARSCVPKKNRLGVPISCGKLLETGNTYASLSYLPNAVAGKNGGTAENMIPKSGQFKVEIGFELCLEESIARTCRPYNGPERP
jgi:hypothetical protein